MGMTQEFRPGDRVRVVEGYLGTVIAEHAKVDGTYYDVILDNGAGEGLWSENELEPTSVVASTISRIAAERRLAAEDYPEVGQLVMAHPDHELSIPEPQSLALALKVAVHEKSAAAKVHCTDCDTDYFADGEDEIEKHKAKHALYLPVNLDKDHRSEGWNDGYQHGYEGTGQKPLRLEAAYVTQYLMGWANGVKERFAPDTTMLTDDLNQQEPSILPMTPIEAKVAGVIRDFIDGWRNPPAAGHEPSFDWCRFRRDSRCYFPKELNRAASDLAGYAVWVPEERGYCKRIAWEDQEACPVSQPGPNVPGGMIDATIPWEDGGQRGGYADQRIASVAAKNPDVEWNFHYTAAWSDVQSKATEIYRSNGVKITQVDQDVNGWPEIVSGSVQGSTGVYQTSLMLVPGSQATETWACDCAWATYAWDRAPQYRRFEGRMCSHALALRYQMQSEFSSLRGEPRADLPYLPRAASIRTAETVRDLTVQRLVETGKSIRDIQQYIDAKVKVAASGKIWGKVNGRVVSLDFHDGQVWLDDMLFEGEILHPDYDPTLGLVASKKERDMDTAEQVALSLLSDEPTPALPVAYGEDEAEEEGQAKTAAKVFSPNEQGMIISEGDGAVTARNLDRLDIAGTHYEALDGIIEPDHDDDTIFW